MKKALYIRVTEHLNTNNLPVGNQFGFRKGTATEDAIFKLRNQILKALNNKTLAGSIFCDLEKTSDSVNHDNLLSKLPHYGISGSGVPRYFVWGGGSTNSVEDRGQRERGSGGGSPLVSGSGGSCNLVQEISFHIVKFS